MSPLYSANDAPSTPAHDCHSSAPAIDFRVIPLQERFAIFEAFELEMKDKPYLSNAAVKITPATPPPRTVACAGRRSVKRVPVPFWHPPVLECLEEEDEEELDEDAGDEEEEDYLDEAESTTACDEWSPVYASRDKPLPLVPRAEKVLPPTPLSKSVNKALPPVPPPETAHGTDPRLSGSRARATASRSQARSPAQA